MTAPPKIQTVMMVDDERFDHMLYRRIMERSGLVGEVLSFIYAEDALAYLDRRDRRGVDVIFVDINMPRMNGFEFLEEAVARQRPDFANKVIVMLTTSLDPSDMARARSNKVIRDYLHKPLTVDDVERIARMVAAS